MLTQPDNVHLLIDTSGDAFRKVPGIAIARVLRDLANRIECDGGQPGPPGPDHARVYPILDVNGNTIGRATVNR